MPETVRVLFRTEHEPGVDRLIREYVLDAVDRLRELDACEKATFVPQAHPETDDRRAVALIARGDADAIADRERDRWNALADENWVEGWDLDVPRDADETADLRGSERHELGDTLQDLATEFAVRTYDAFDDLDTRPDAVETFPDAGGPGSVGWWTVLHILTVQVNYSLDEELAAYQHGVEHTLRNIAEYEGSDVMEDRLDALIDDLESQRDAFKNGRPDTE